MFDDLEAHFLEGVLPAYDAFVQSLKSDTAGLSKDLRLGKDAALALFHLREHVPWARGKQWPAFLTACAEYALLQDIVNVFKHGPRRDGQIAGPSDIYETIVLTDYEDADGIYGHPEKEVTIQLRNGSVSDMNAVLSAVLDVWIAEFKARGLLLRLEWAKRHTVVIPPRSVVSGAAPINIAVLQGLRANLTLRRQRFNYATGKIEPIDITGHEYVFSVYEPIEANITLTNAEGQRIEGIVQLSAEDATHYQGLKTDSERKAFEAELAPKYARQLLAKRTG
jgi:hypothetical protein